jgi:hypothetical protein
MLAKKTSKNQITLPKKVVDALPPTDYFDVVVREGEVVLRPVAVTARGERLRAVREKIRRLGLTDADLTAAIRWAGGKRR